MSESFANRAVTGSGSYPTSGTGGTTSAGPASLTVAYDAATQGYTITVAGRSQTFLPSHIDGTLGTAQITAYKRVSGNTTDTLALSKPGTAGALTYRYVGSGYWQRTLQTSSTISATIDAFVYGVKTSDAALRRTGAARYGVDLQGAMAYLDQPVNLSGSGTLDVDFETLAITTNGQYTETGTAFPTSGIGNWNGAATLSSTANAFSGTARVGGVQSAAMNGLFFGPATDEVGAAISGRESLSGISVVATLMGRKTQELVSSATNKDLVTLTKDVNFVNGASGVRFSKSSGTGAFSGSTLTNGGVSASTVGLNYTVASQSYAISDQIAPFTGSGPGAYSATFAPADINSAQSSGNFTTYQRTAGGVTSTLKLYKPAGSNSQIALTYTGLGQLVTSAADSGSDTWFFYGLPTSAGGNYSIPTGTATYTGAVFGTATPNIAGQSLGSLSGPANLSVNFTANSFTGSMAPLITLYSNGSTVNPGSYTFTNGVIGQAGFPGSLSAGVTGPGNDTGALYGLFFGNLATEFGATFKVDTFATPSAVEYALTGAIVGKKN